MKTLTMLGLLVASALAAPEVRDFSVRGTTSTQLDCLDQEDNIISCFFVKAATSLDRAARSTDIQLIDGVTFVRDIPMERSGKSLKTEVEVMNELPRDASERALKLAGMMYDAAVSFVQSHSLKLSMPEGSISRALTEGRGKIKKVILPLIAAAGVKIFALAPILLGGLGLLALKALVVGKIALLLAGILAFQKLFSSGGVASNYFSKTPQVGGNWLETGGQGWAAGGAATQQQGYYRRSFDEAAKMDAHSMAYSAQAPTSNETD